jgi:hypothetical protein
MLDSRGNLSTLSRVLGIIFFFRFTIGMGALVSIHRGNALPFWHVIETSALDGIGTRKSDTIAESPSPIDGYASREDS